MDEINFVAWRKKFQRIQKTNAVERRKEQRRWILERFSIKNQLMWKQESWDCLVEKKRFFA